MTSEPRDVLVLLPTQEQLRLVVGVSRGTGAVRPGDGQRMGAHVSRQ
jgi:hypothetical protein